MRSDRLRERTVMPVLDSLGPYHRPLMEKFAFFEDLQARINRLFDESPAADVRNNLRALLQQAFEKFDLATREQLDLQTQLLDRAQARIDALEARIARLEGERAPSPLQDSTLG
jgi:ubiquinone biosynthesis accessory factor UbiK